MWIVAVVMLVASVVAGVAAVGHSRSVERAWRELAVKLGLDVLGERRLSGVLHGRRVTIEHVVRGSGKNRQVFTVLSVSAPGAASGLRIRGEWTWTRLQKLAGVEDVRVMDEAFDRVVHVQGDEVQAVALLGEDTRRELAMVVGESAVELEFGWFRREFPGHLTDAARLAWLANACARVASRLDLDPSCFEEELARHVLEDSNPAVRLRNFELLQARFHGHATTRRVAEAALSDDHLALRVAAARELADDRAFEVLRRITEANGNAESRLAALDALLDLFPYERTAPTLDMVLRSGRPELRARAVEAIGVRKDASRRASVERCLGMGDDGLDLAAVKALALLADPASEDVLVARLASTSEAVKRATVEALGALASTRAVEALLPLSQGFSLGGGLKDAARDAVRRIQSRVGPADGGRLSLVSPPDTEGALSIATDGGGLSVVEQEGGAPRASTKVRG